MRKIFYRLFLWKKTEALAKFFHQASLFFILDVFAVDRNLGFLFVFVNFGQRLLLVSNFFLHRYNDQKRMFVEASIEKKQPKFFM